MKPAIQKLFKNETFLATLLIFLTTLVTYGINIPKLGYYYDDWYMLWSGAARGAQSIIPLFSTDRPFMGVVYSIVYRFLGDTIVNWQLYALLWRFIGALAFFWILRLLWPNNKSLTALMTVLFIVYPGFLSQPDANTKQNQLYGFGTGLLSIAFMLQAIKADNRKWKAVCGLLSVILTVNYLFIYEYMIGLEGMRLALLGYILFRDGFKTWRVLAVDVLKRWWPYVIASAAFLYWRLFIFEGARNATNASRLAGSYLNDLRHMSLRLVIGTAKDFLSTSIFAWFVKPYQSFSSAEYSNLGIALLIAGIVIALVLTYSFLLKRWWGVDDNRDEKPRPIKDWVLIGAFSVVCAVAPVIASGRNVDLGDAYKSYGLHPMGGAVLLVGGLLLMLRPKFRKLALIALIGFSVSTQALNADYWGRLWNYERQTWWQLTWRAPDIKNDTLVMTYYPEGYQQQQDYETWGPVNLIYRPGPATSPAITSEVLNSETAYDILRKVTMTNPVRDIPMHRDFNKLLLISVPSSSACIHVIDGTLPAYSEDDALLVQQVGSYSHIDRIVPFGAAPVPQSRIFGSEPPHTWCYYYQKASLARQTGNWKEVGKLYDQTVALHLDASDPSEMVPFFEGLVNLGRVDDATALYNKEIKGHTKLRFPLCVSLSKDPRYPAEFGYNYKMIFEILCK
ncbi:MAG: hypothetical protein WA821_05185 [Anaerolineales bacterium]